MITNFLANSKSILMNSQNIYHIVKKLLPDDFTFVIDGEQYNTNKIFASFLSPIIYQSILVDPFYDSFTISNINDPHKDFIFFLNICENGEIKIDPLANFEFILEICDILGNKEIKQLIFSHFFDLDHITPDNLLDELITAGKLVEVDNDKLLKASAKFFYGLIKEEKFNISNISIGTMKKIISNDSLVIDSESSLFDFIIKLYDDVHSFYNDPVNERKINNINHNDYKNLDEYSIKSEIEGLFENVNFDYIEHEKILDFINNNRIAKKKTMAQIIGSLIEKKGDSVTNKIPNNNINECRYRIKEFVPGKSPLNQPFNGIINYLNSLCENKNCAFSNIIEVSASSTQSNFSHKDPRFVCNHQDLHKTSMWSPDCELNGYIQFDFKEKSVKLTHYILQTPIEKTGDTPRNWSVEGSNDKLKWVCLDYKENNSDFQSSGNIKCIYQTRDNENDNANGIDTFRYIRIYCRGVGWGRGENRYFIDLSAVEFYGQLVTNFSINCK